MSLIDYLQTSINISKGDLLNLINNAPNLYKKYQIDKRNGSKRDIIQPTSELKTLQYLIINKYLLGIDLHKISMGYIRGISSPLRKNALLHSKYDHSVRLDFKDFFPSIKKNDVKSHLLKYELFTDPEDYNYLNKIAFPKAHLSKGLPIGSPISPILSNIIMIEFDQITSELAKSISTNSAISRYADDIVFSNNSKTNCKDFVEGLKNLVSELKSPRLSLNDKKTIFMPKGNRRIITGLIITPDKKISIGKERKNHINFLIREFLNGNYKNKNKLKGLLAFVLDVEPDFYNRLHKKYGPNLSLIYN